MKKLTPKRIVDALIGAAIHLIVKAVWVDLEMSDKITKTGVGLPISHERPPEAPQS